MSILLAFFDASKYFWVYFRSAAIGDSSCAFRLGSIVVLAFNFARDFF